MWDVVGSGLLGSLVGLYAGNKFAVWREKRKEFNESTKSLRHKLRRQIQQLERSFIGERLRDDDLDEIVGALGEVRAKEIIACFKRYDATLRKGTWLNAGQLVPSSPHHKKELLEDAKKLYRLVQPK